MTQQLMLVEPTKNGIVIDKDAIAIGKVYQKAKTSIADSIHYAIECGHRLIAKKKSVGHGQWLLWLAEHGDVLGFSDRKTASRLIAAAAKWGAGAPFDEAEAIAISRLVWGHNVRGCGGTGEDEWHTPREYVDLARAVLGGIDLDPATSEQAQETVQADRYFTAEHDGLKHQWPGRVWLNPPYARSLIPQFVHKLCEEIVAGRVTAAIMLTHNYTDTTWFHEAAQLAGAICFPQGRVTFCAPDGELANPTQGQTFFYFGKDTRRFGDLFRDVGRVWVPFR
jgi:phage N-6-adenine-methyltransferase